MTTNRVVVVVGMPRLQRDIVASALEHAGLDVLEGHPGPVGYAGGVLIAGPAVDAPESLLTALDPRAVIVLSGGGRRARLLDVVVRSRDLGELDVAKLVDLILEL